MHDIHSFFKSINFIPEKNTFDEIEIEKVILNKKSETFNVYLYSKNVLPIEEVDALLNAKENKINGIYKCNIILK